MKLTKNFTLKEFERSTTADAKDIDNSAPDNVIANLKILSKEVLQPVHDLIGQIVQHDSYYIRITSGYRCKELNKAVGGSPTSFHALGYAADCELYIKGKESNAILYHIIKARGIYTELIWEYHKNITNDMPKWVHIAFDKNRKDNSVKYIS